MTKKEISELVNNNEVFKKILSLYKNNNKTSGKKIEFDYESKNGLLNNIYVISTNSDINTIIVPIFSTQKTITWDFNFNDIIKSLLDQEFNTDFEMSEITNKIKCPLYYFDSADADLIYLSYVKLSDWLDNGHIGRNKKSVYFWNDKLPNKYNITKKQIINDIFIETLPYLNKTELKTICKDYAEKYYKKYGGDKRDSKTKIKNITDGLYAELTIYNQLFKAGYDVSLNWSTEDDLGIDILFNINGETIFIDVKSTKTKDLKINRNRKNTDFYAICTWDKTKPVLIGFLHKHYFWKSKVFKTDKPIKKDEMYTKPINELVDNIVNINDIYGQYTQYKKLKMKMNEQLFEV